MQIPAHIRLLQRYLLPNDMQRGSEFFSLVQRGTWTVKLFTRRPLGKQKALSSAELSRQPQTWFSFTSVFKYLFTSLLMDSLFHLLNCCFPKCGQCSSSSTICELDRNAPSLSQPRFHPSIQVCIEKRFMGCCVTQCLLPA